jgi:hypothetical protein
MKTLKQNMQTSHYSAQHHLNVRDPVLGANGLDSRLGSSVAERRELKSFGVVSQRRRRRRCKKS